VGYIGSVPGMQKEVVLQHGRDFERRGNGVTVLRGGGGIICHDKEVV